MNIVLKKSRGTISRSYRSFAKQKIQSVCSRFSAHITSINVFFTDLNGPKGGIDKQCKIVVYPAHGGVLVISEKQANWPAAIINAARRTKSGIACTVDKLRPELESSTGRAVRKEGKRRFYLRRRGPKHATPDFEDVLIGRSGRLAYDRG